MPPGKKKPFPLWPFILFAIALVYLPDLYADREESIRYSSFKQLLQTSQLEALVITPDVIRGKAPREALAEIVEPERADAIRKQTSDHLTFVTVRIDDPRLVEQLEAAKVQYAAVLDRTWFTTLLSWVFPLAIFVLFWSFMFRRMGAGSGMMAIGKSKAKVYIEQDTKVTFHDVAGVDEAKAELEEVVNFLKEPLRYGRLGAHIPKGVLLIGPPGTGKTLLARAVAGQAGVPFLSISGSEFVEMFVGVGAARVRDLFDQARQMAPAIIFIDELDALGRARGANPLMQNDEKEQTLNQLLVEMDGFDTRSGLVLLAATNRPEILDPALLRAGRFDRQVLVDRPDKIGRGQILKVHLKKIKLQQGLDVEQIAAMTPGFSGADLANLVNEAALLATRRDADAVGLDDFTAAIERLIAGLEKKNRLLNIRERTVVAHHELGHALVAMAMPDADPVHKVSIIPRGIGALGYTMQRPTEDRFLLSEDELRQRMAVLLGGRAAERLIFDSHSTGAADDLEKATEIARNMVMRFGMNSALGQVTYDKSSPGLLGGRYGESQREYSEATAEAIDTAVRELIETAFLVASDVLTAQKQLLIQGAELLLQKETLTGEELQNLLKRARKALPAGRLNPVAEHT